MAADSKIYFLPVPAGLPEGVSNGVIYNTTGSLSRPLVKTGRSNSGFNGQTTTFDTLWTSFLIISGRSSRIFLRRCPKVQHFWFLREGEESLQACCAPLQLLVPGSQQVEVQSTTNCFEQSPLPSSRRAWSRYTNINQGGPRRCTHTVEAGEQIEDSPRSRVLLRQRKKTKQLPAQLLLPYSGITTRAVILGLILFPFPQHLCAVLVVSLHSQVQFFQFNSTDHYQQESVRAQKSSWRPQAKTSPATLEGSYGHHYTTNATPVMQPWDVQGLGSQGLLH
ncbi:uncharacterized protein LOC101697093 [Heterocephalus glaber]|uniref:Uncharacterized protein LOC101697093 n=1 Tax=Heterocephalus glaber TaxID=10181 RepID=A0AAX6T6C6_HETGA|nr:uncharacterized protein LOC101697093 [Heterocephalus glaber]